MADAELSGAGPEQTDRIITVCLGVLLLLVSIGMTAAMLFAKRPDEAEPRPVVLYALLLVVMWALSVGSLTSPARRPWLRQLSRWFLGTGALGLAAFLICVWVRSETTGTMDPAAAALAGVLLFIVAVGLALFIGERRRARRAGAEDAVFTSPMAIVAWPILVFLKSPAICGIVFLVVIGVSYVGALIGATRGVPLVGALSGTAFLLLALVAAHLIARRATVRERSDTHNDDDVERGP